MATKRPPKYVYCPDCTEYPEHCDGNHPVIKPFQRKGSYSVKVHRGTPKPLCEFQTQSWATKQMKEMDLLMGKSTEKEGGRLE